MNSSFEYNTSILIEPINITSVDLINESTFNEWKELPYEICDGLSCKRIKTPEEYNGFLLKYDTNSYTVPHINADEYEVLNVKYGTITNLITGESFTEGETLVIDKGEVHEIYCNSEAYIYFITTKSKSALANLTKVFD